jgi:hypothetical protein
VLPATVIGISIVQLSNYADDAFVKRIRDRDARTRASFCYKRAVALREGPFMAASFAGLERQLRAHAAITGATRNALAAMVRLGLTAPLRGMKEESTTNRLANPCALQFLSNTLIPGSSPNRHVPHGCP